MTRKKVLEATWRLVVRLSLAAPEHVPFYVAPVGSEIVRHLVQEGTATAYVRT